MQALQLLLLDSRAPAGGHAHSGGMEPAVDAGLVRDLADVEAFCRGRLRTSGRVAAAFAAAAHDLMSVGPAAGRHAGEIPATEPTEAGSPDAGPTAAAPTDATLTAWAQLDAEYDARLPSEALRAASRQLGGGLRRLLRSMFPAVELPWTGAAPHHPIALGTAVALAGGTRDLAAEAAVLSVVSAPASAAVRLLGLDPIAVHAMLARVLTSTATNSGSLAGHYPANEPLFVAGKAAGLPADSAPLLDLLADVHRKSEVRLFAS